MAYVAAMEIRRRFPDSLTGLHPKNAVTHDFTKMIERASRDVTLFPGDLIGSGTVGTGCILELGPETAQWARGRPC